MRYFIGRLSHQEKNKENIAESIVQTNYETHWVTQDEIEFTEP